MGVETNPEGPATAILAEPACRDNAGGAPVNPIPQITLVGVLTSSGLVVVEVPR